MTTMCSDGIMERETHGPCVMYAGPQCILGEICKVLSLALACLGILVYISPFRGGHPKDIITRQ